jgi:hypothetical protein
VAKIAFKKYSGTGVCDVCGTSVGANEAYLVPVDIFYSSAKYKKSLQNNPLRLAMGGSPYDDMDAYLATMRAMDPTEFSACCSDCVKLFT